MAMLLSDAYQLSGTPEELSQVAGCSVADFETAYEALAARRVCYCNKGSNGLVTLTSRRLEREHNKRESSKLRVRAHRAKSVCNADVTSASASASDSKGVCKGENVTESAAVELPPYYPQTEQEAVNSCMAAGVPDEFIRTTWNLGAGRGGRDGKDVPIRQFTRHVKAAWSFAQDRNERNGHKPNGHPIPQTDEDWANLGYRTIR